MDKNINQPDQLLAEIIEAWYKFQDLMPEDETSDTTEYLKQEGRVATLIHKAEQFLARPAEAPAFSADGDKAAELIRWKREFKNVHRASIEHYLEGGSITGSLYQFIEAVAARAPMMEKELQEAKAKLLKAWQTCTSLHIMLNKCQPYIADLQTDNIHDPSVGIRRDDDLQALADEMKHFVDVKSIDAYHESMSKELQEARAALKAVHDDEMFNDITWRVKQKVAAALSTNLKDR